MIRSILTVLAVLIFTLGAFLLVHQPVANTFGIAQCAVVCHGG